ncbi:MAG: glycosyltransferase [Patescibacteria group bacterium]
MHRILFIPHGSDPNLNVRGRELAEALATRQDCEVFCIEYARNFSNRFIDKLWFLIANLLRTIEVSPLTKRFSLIRFPYLNLALTPRTLPLIRRFADSQIEQIIKKIRPTIIVNESHFAITVARSSNYQLIYDLVDDHLPGSIDGWFGQMVAKFTTKQLALADRIWTISHTLIDKLGFLGHHDVQYVPNGTQLETFRSQRSLRGDELKELRLKLNLENKYTIGYIGNHASWSGIDFVIKLAKAAPPDWHFLVIGGGTEVDAHQPNNFSNLQFLGAIPREKIAQYFLTVDVGILPFIKNSLTDSALPLKIIEYGAAHKVVVAEPLTELEYLQLPYVRFPKERTPEAWLETLQQVQNSNWQQIWNTSVAAYDWQTIAQHIKFD